eukprot:gene34018-12580_t
MREPPWDQYAGGAGRDLGGIFIIGFDTREITKFLHGLVQGSKTRARTFVVSGVDWIHAASGGISPNTEGNLAG